jgi:hypothetical protein
MKVQSVFRRIAILVFASLAILSTAASCSLNPFGSKSPAGFYGILKQDPLVKKDTFGKINAVKTINSKVDPTGLEPLSITKLEQINKDTLFALTREKGVFRTIDGGKNWQRIYTFPVVYTEEKEKQKQLEEDLKKNDELTITDFYVDPANTKLVYMSANSGKKGKIFKTEDGGKTVREVYSEINGETSVDFVVIDPSESNHVYALLNKNALIATNDGGKTWQKINDYTKEKDKIMQIGFLPDSGNFFILYEKLGLATSNDGLKWTKQNIVKKQPEPETPEPPIETDTSKTTWGKIKDKVYQGTTTAKKIIKNLLPPFKLYQKLIPIGSTEDGKKPAILIADKEIWITDDVITSQFTQIKNVPVQDDKVDYNDVAVDPFVGPQKIYLAIGNKLLISDNGGESWYNKNLGVENNGQITQIVLDKTEPNTIYLSLANIEKKK